MGIKFLSFHMIPWCFHVMGNHVSSVHHLPQESSLRTVKLIRSDGLVQIYHRPINASELMVEFPKHLICHSDSFLIGQKIPALSENDELKLGHKYFLLPKHFFQSVLSFVTIASFASTPSSESFKRSFVKKTANCRPFDIHKTSSGTLQIRVSDEFISKLMEEGKIREEEDENEMKSRVCTTPQLHKDYTQLVGCRRSQQWRPKLETIREAEKRRKIAAFGMKRRKKSQSKTTQKIQKSEKGSHGPPTPPLPLPSFPKIRGRKRLEKSKEI